MFQTAWKRLTFATAIAVGLALAAGPAEAGWHHWYHGAYVVAYPAVAYDYFVGYPILAGRSCCGYWGPSYGFAGDCCGYGYGYRYGSWYGPAYSVWSSEPCCGNVYSSWYAPAYSVWPSQPCCGGAIAGPAPAAPVPQPAETVPNPPRAQPAPAPANPNELAPPPADRSLLRPESRETTPADPNPVGKAPAIKPRATPAPPAAADDGPLLPPNTKDFVPPANDNVPLPTPKETRERPRDEAILAVTVPEQAKVFVNGKLTRTPGTRRQYVARDMQPGFPYTYEVRAEILVNGRWIRTTRVIQLHAGQTLEVAFDWTASQPRLVQKTTLTLHVPENAVVELSGRPTHATGNVRQFTTTGLAIGQKWENYRVAVSVERNGRVLHRETTLTLVGGESQELTFPFADEQLAQR